MLASQPSSSSLPPPSPRAAPLMTWAVLILVLLFSLVLWAWGWLLSPSRQSPASPPESLDPAPPTPEVLDTIETLIVSDLSLLRMLP